MIPIKDNIHRRTFPAVTLLIIFANIAIFIYQLSTYVADNYDIVYNYGAIPLFFTDGLVLFLAGDPLFMAVLPNAVMTLFTSVFLHGGWLHLLGNMLYLWVFGPNVEGRLGSFKFLVLYLLMGAAGSLFHIALNPESPVPLIGASGAIAGVLGLYFMFYPGAKVLTLVPIFFFITFIHIPALIFLGFWFLLQLNNAFGAESAAGMQSVAWWAHVGGFTVGLILGIVNRRKKTDILRY